jgi:penicillin amidase
MKIFKVGLSALITVSLIWTLNRSWNVGQSIPPLGKFLDPFHGFWQNAEKAPTASQSITISGLQGEVTIVYDSALIPHIFAQNEDDLFLAQGFVTAQHRLWQMEFQTHAGAGRISEIIGSAALSYDRQQRRLGLMFGAQQAYDGIKNNPTSARMLENFSKGVNAYISQLTYEDFPLEYKLLDYAPEEWTEMKSAILLKNMAQTLNMGEKDLEMTNTLHLFGKEMVALLYPDFENVGDPIVDQKEGWRFQPVTTDSVPLALPAGLASIPTNPKMPVDVGSNNWAVNGNKTLSGSPILCNDPHLNLSLPSIWYIVRLHAPGINVMGASLPGSPAVISGFNDSIAWGVTNAQRDLVDWFQIKFKDSSKKEYLSDDAWKPSRQVIEHIKVKGGEDFYDTVTYTHHGPVVYDEGFQPERELKHYAFRWIAHDPSNELQTFYELNKANNHRDYMNALDHYSSPAQNFVFASVSGDVAMRIQGRFPVRRPGEGKFVLDGTQTNQEWQAFIPNEHNITYKNPSRNFVSSANQFPVDETYPYYINGNSWEAYRNRRINKILSESEDITPADMKELQADNYNLKAEESLPLFLKSIDTTLLSADERKAFTMLSRWNYVNDADSEGASYYEAWWDALYPMIWDEMNNDSIALEYPTTYTTIHLIKTKPELVFFDVMATPEKETAREVLQKSFSKGVEAVEKWKKEKGINPAWGDYKNSFIGHLLRGLPAFSYHVRHGGNHDIVNAHSRTHGPSWRMVVSLEKTGVKAWGIYPGGQSGNPGSPYYNNLIDTWVKDNYLTFNFASLEKIQKYSLTITTLIPTP